jgi:hypothetical protein
VADLAQVQRCVGRQRAWVRGRRVEIAIVMRGGRSGEAEQDSGGRGDGNEYPLHG